MNTTPPSELPSTTDQEPTNLTFKCDGAFEHWRHEQVGPAYDAMKTDPSRTVTVDRVRARLAAEHKRATSKA